jgi:hypothetical protein
MGDGDLLQCWDIGRRRKYGQWVELDLELVHGETGLLAFLEATKGVGSSRSQRVLGVV